MADSTPADFLTSSAIEGERKSLASWFWNRFSITALAAAETQLLANVKAKIISRLVPVRMGYIYTLIANSIKSDPARVPITLIHGFAGGVGLWAGNIDVAAENRTAYAFDVIGFARSSRPTFSKDSTLVEMEFVQSIENWRKELNIDKMVLVGHSFGAYLASSYALEHPERVRHLVLVDPWGFPEKPPPPSRPSNPAWIRAVALAVSMFNPLTALRVAGPYGSSLVKKLRPDLSSRFGCSDSDTIYDYIYQCNVQRPTGEIAFSDMSYSFGWAKRPMLERIIHLPNKIPITFIYGSKSWIDSSSGILVQEARPDSYVDVQVINGAGHHVYADQRSIFNEVLADLLRKIDLRSDLVMEDDES